MRHATAALLVLSLGIHQVVHAQLPLTVGQRVRITSIRDDVHAQVGKVLSTTGDSVVILVKGIRTDHYRQVYRTDTIALPVIAIDRLEVSKPGPSETMRGMRTGATVGTLAGFLYGIATYKECQPTSSLYCLYYPTQIVNGMGGALGGAVIGGAIGAIIGSTFHEQRWMDVPTRHVSLFARPRGAGIGLSFPL